VLRFQRDEWNPAAVVVVLLLDVTTLLTGVSEASYSLLSKHHQVSTTSVTVYQP
jgi:hypothetical protein